MPNSKFLLCLLKGPSGTGKGTRTSQLMQWLDFTKCEKLNFVKNGESIGVLYPSNGVMFIGQMVNSNKSGLTSWSSMDMIHSKFHTAEAGREVLKEAIAFCMENNKTDSFALVAEGEPMFLSDKFRPTFIEAEYKPDVLFMPYYLYSAREQYEERIMGRSGCAGGDSGWSRAQSYESDFTKAKDESVLCEAMESRVSIRKHDETYWKWGSEVLALLGCDEITVGRFIEWSKNNPQLRSVGGPNPMNKTKKLW